MFIKLFYGLYVDQSVLLSVFTFDCFRNPEGAKNYSILQSQMSIRKRRYRFRRQIKSENIQDTPNILNKDKSNKLCKLDNSNKFIKSEKLELSDNLDISQESNKPVKLKKSKKRVKSDKLINTSRALTLVNPLPLGKIIFTNVKHKLLCNPNIKLVLNMKKKININI